MWIVVLYIILCHHLHRFRYSSDDYIEFTIKLKTIGSISFIVASAGSYTLRWVSIVNKIDGQLYAVSKKQQVSSENNTIYAEIFA